MSNVECFVKPSILNAILLVNGMHKSLVYVVFKYVFLFYNHKLIWINWIYSIKTYNSKKIKFYDFWFDPLCDWITKSNCNSIFQYW